MDATVEELPENKVRLTVGVPPEHLQHAVDHAASDLAASVKIPGFRKGKVPMQVLLARLGKDRVYAEAVESHIGGWFRSAAATTRIRPVARPEYDYTLPESPDSSFSFTATVAVQPKVEVADWRALEVPVPEPKIPEDVVDRQLESLRHAVAELAPVEGRPAQEGDVGVFDIEGEGRTERDVVGDVDDRLAGLSAGESRELEGVSVTLKELKERVLPPVDDALARAASEFDTIAELRADIEKRLEEQIAEEIESRFRANAADALVLASNVQPSAALVEGRAQELLHGLVHSLEQQQISVDTYLAVTNTTAEQLQERIVGQAARAVARELVLEAVADKEDIQIPDEELRAFIRDNATQAGEQDPDAVVEQIWMHGRHEVLREDLRLRKALDKVVAEVKRISPELADARDKLWTPEKEKGPEDTKLWTPGSKEPA